MRQVQSPRRSAIIGILLVILLICAAASLAVLFDRLSAFNPEGFQNIIPLTESGGNTIVKIGTANATAANQSGHTSGNPERPSETRHPANGGNSQFTAYDENTVWSAETEVEIFKLSYGESGQITVQSSDGDKLFAPGTSNEYTFTLENTGDVPLDYTMSMEAWFGSEYVIPITATVRDYYGGYLLGSPNNRPDVLELNKVGENGVLGAGRCAIYTLDWEWEFESGRDEYDTMLGNLAVDEDITLTVKILTTAQYDADPGDPAVSGAGIESPKTGDDMPVVPLTAVFVIAVAVAAACCFVKRYRNEE